MADQMCHAMTQKQIHFHLHREVNGSLSLCKPE